MIKRLVVVMMSVALSAATAQSAINATGDVAPPDPATWTTVISGYVGKTGEGSVAVDDGSDLLSYNGYIGRYSGATGVVTISGTGSTWSSRKKLYAGFAGDGTLDIADGAAVSSTTGAIGYGSGSGTVTVSGSDSSWTNSQNFYVGNYGNAILGITDGGAVSSGWISIGYESGSIGEAAVSGSGSTLTDSGEFHIGYYGSGTVNITAGGAVSNYHGFIGANANSVGVATVSGTGSTWTNTGDLFAGYDGAGTLDVAGGGTVSNCQGHIGIFSGSTGVVAVRGAGTRWLNSDDLSLGYFGGTGMLGIANGGLVVVGDQAGELLTIFSADDFVDIGWMGALAIYGQADDSLATFLTDMVDGVDANVRYWDDGAWHSMQAGTRDVDYTLVYHTTGDLAGYTVLTGIPEPASLGLLAIGAAMAVRPRRCRCTT